MSLNVTAAQAHALGVSAGTQIALMRTSSGLEITNLTYVHGLVGRGIVRRVTDRSVTFVNNAGTHTIALARAVISRLQLHRGSTIMVSASGGTLLEVSAPSSRR
jgi:hypothetical protein